MIDTQFIDQGLFLKLILDNIPQSIFWKDLNNVYQGCNSNFAALAGLSNPREIVGKTDHDMPWGGDAAAFCKDVEEQVIATGQPALNIEETFPMPDGQLGWFRINKIPLFNSNAASIGILTTFEDITQRKEMEISLREQKEELAITNVTLKEVNEELEQANFDLEHFAFAASHDLQEPMRNIGNFVSLIQKKYYSDIDTTYQSYFEFILEGVNRMSKLISGILNYSKLNEKDQDIRPLDLNLLLQEELKSMEAYLRIRNAQVHWNMPNKPVVCQENQIRLLFKNLIMNGVKFNRDQRPFVQIDFEETSDQWLFICKDNGIGIEGTYDELIYKTFKRLNNREEFSGVGIGLSICQRIAKLHQGTIWHKSVLGEGSTFYFTIAKGLAGAVTTN